MKINELSISGIGGIRELQLAFNPKFNVICGPNGIGKTTVLRIIAHSFSSSNTSLKRNATYTEGKYTIKYTDLLQKEISKNYIIKEFDPQRKDTNLSSSNCSPYIMNFLENRTIEYTLLPAVPRDPESNKYQIAGALEKGIQVNDLKGWFDNRWLFSKSGEDGLTVSQRENLELAIRSFSILDANLTFCKVDSRSLDIMLTSSNGVIYFEYLSAGYKSCIYLIIGLIKEIEYRFGQEAMRAVDFNGVILIDEIDLHLHPTWQAKLIETLKELFPSAQFIITTHSPSVLQISNKEELIPLTQDEDGNIRIKELNLTEYGLQGWSLEEILRDVMEMPETTSKVYNETKEAFDKAMNEENSAEVLKQYGILKKMLHPDSVLRRLIDIQVAGMGE